MGKVWFVSGIDTGIGKTVATGLMARWLSARGVDALTVKMVQTGCDGFSEDLDEHRRMCGAAKQPEDEEGLTAPQIFRYPSSPLLAARREGRQVDLAKIATAVRECAARREAVLVEGAGGLAVPLADDGTLAADFAASQGWPLILVGSARLGSINHVVLSLEAAKSRGIQVAGVVHNWHRDSTPEISADAIAETRRHLARLGFPPAVVEVPEVKAGAALPCVDFGPVFG